MSAAVTWTKGGSAEIVALTGDAVTLVSTTPAPPGSRVEGRAALDVETAIKVKVHSSKRGADGAFTIEGRMLDATRAVLDAISALCAPPRA